MRTEAAGASRKATTGAGAQSAGRRGAAAAADPAYSPAWAPRFRAKCPPSRLPAFLVRECFFFFLFGGPYSLHILMQLFEHCCVHCKIQGQVSAQPPARLSGEGMLFLKNKFSCLGYEFCVVCKILMYFFGFQCWVGRSHGILMWIRIWIRGSMPLWLMDPDPAIFFIDLQDANKKLIKKKFFCSFLFEGTFSSFFKDKKSKRRHKAVGIKVLLLFA